MIFDTHAHYDDPRFDEDREALLASMAEQGVGHIINIGANMKGSFATVELVKKYPWFYGAVGVHPDEVGELTEERMETLTALSREERIVAIGEIGLDYAFYGEPTEEEAAERKRQQKYWFEKQLELARRLELPVVIHSRDATEDTLQVMREHTSIAKAEGSFRGGVIHCFSGSPEVAREYVEMGYYIGIGGVVTFKNAKKLPDVVEDMPMSRILLETDCPYLAPVPHRGKRNDSALLCHVVEKIAELRGVTPEEVIRVTEANARRCFSLD